MIQLRMRGLPAPLVVSALIAAWPLAFVLYVRLAQHQHVDGSLLALAIGAAALPWTSRLAGRLTYRAAVDDFALHVAGEALPWDKITRVLRHRTWRRRSLVLERGRTSRVVLVTHDLFAGRLEPLDELLRRLPEAVRPN